MTYVKTDKRNKTFDLWNPVQKNYLYWIGWDQVDTPEKFEDMRRHLLEKNWVELGLILELRDKASKLWPQN